MDDGRREPVMFQLVDALDGDAARGANLLDLNGWVLSVLIEDGGGTDERLEGKLTSFLRRQTQFDAGLDAGLDILEHIGDATRGEGGACGHLALGDEQHTAQTTKELGDECILLGGGVALADERHTLLVADGGVGDDAEHGLPLQACVAF